jgi:hypothetical protein
MSNSSIVAANSFHRPPPEYDVLLHPLPTPSHSSYPFYTPGGGDTRWVGPGEAEEEGLQWVGCILSAHSANICPQLNVDGNF